MAKVPLGVRVPPELIGLIEKEVSEGKMTKVEIVEESIRERYATRHTDGPEPETEESESAVVIGFIQHLQEQVEKKDLRIEDLERINNNYAAKILDTSKLIEAPAQASRWDRFKDVFR